MTKDAASKELGTRELAHFPLTSINSFNGFQICSFSLSLSILGSVYPHIYQILSAINTISVGVF